MSFTISLWDETSTCCVNSGILPNMPVMYKMHWRLKDSNFIVFQFCYTTLFGAYSAFLLLRTSMYHGVSCKNVEAPSSDVRVRKTFHFNIFENTFKFHAKRSTFWGASFKNITVTIDLIDSRYVLLEKVLLANYNDFSCWVTKHMFSFTNTDYVVTFSDNLMAPVIVHAFCNHMGFPNFREVFAYEQPKRGQIMASFVFGAVAWCFLLYPMTSPALYNNKFYTIWILGIVLRYKIWSDDRLTTGWPLGWF